MKKFLIIIAYDISSNKSRNQVHKIIQEWRVGGQKSVHECWLSRKQAEALYLKISLIINMDTDKLLMASILPKHQIYNAGKGCCAGKLKPLWYIA